MKADKKFSHLLVDDDVDCSFNEIYLIRIKKKYTKDADEHNIMSEA